MTTADLDAYRGMNYDVAEAIAPTWERRRAQIEEVATPLREWLTRELAPQPGETILELAGGTGDTGFDAAAALGEHGKLISSDFSPAMLDAARRRGAERGVANVDYRLIDAEQIGLEDDSVDGVICRFGYMLIADPAAALAETRRVLRPGGRLVLGVWGPPERNPFFTAIVIGLVEGGHMSPPDPTGPGIFSMASEERTTALLEGAGFTDIRIEHLTFHFEIPDIEEYLSVIADTAGPVALVLRRLSAPDREVVREHAEAALEGFRGEHGYRIPGLVLAAGAS
jgi:ubiquinone/menaquinone biosynthesis C-methylase UbiE